MIEVLLPVTNGLEQRALLVPRRRNAQGWASDQLAMPVQRIAPDSDLRHERMRRVHESIPNARIFADDRVSQKGMRIRHSVGAIGIGNEI